MAKKNKLKKILSPVLPSSPAPPSDAVDDDALLEDLMAQLDSKDEVVRQESATVLNEMQINQVAEQLDSAPKKDSKARYKARQVKKAAALADSYAPDDAEADARLQREAEQEDASIKRVCEELGLTMHEITPDGHCLFSAVADQLAQLGILPPAHATHAVTRAAAADYIYTHAADFLPFLPASEVEAGAAADSAGGGLMSPAQLERYCTTMRNTAVWGGEPEILALSRAYKVPVHVVQAGTPSVVEHSPEEGGRAGAADTVKGVVYISYHRRLYGLGEHYNSLRPRSILNTIKSNFPVLNR